MIKKFQLIWLPLFLFSCATTKVKNLSKAATPSDVLIPITKTDLLILERATELLSEESKWNRLDNRDCPGHAQTFSLYCALYKASLDTNGLFDHRLAVLEETRRTVEEVSKGKSYEHRLMGYNNDPATQFQDIKNVLVITRKRLEKRLR